MIVGTAGKGGAPCAALGALQAGYRRAQLLHNFSHLSCGTRN